MSDYEPEYDPIFKNTYWARGGNSLSKPICINRNQFKEEFDLKREILYHYENRKPVGLGKRRYEKEVFPEGARKYNAFDHFELYERNNKKGFVAIFSPYSDKLNEDCEYHRVPLDLGYKKHHSNLYCTQGSTYIKLLPLKK
tara:strand:+ start:2241 stop:2663 length:423 start_codon:yes stop_codon:yes gene_type:complete